MEDIKSILKRTKEIVLDPEADIPSGLQSVAFVEVFKLLISNKPDQAVTPIDNYIKNSTNSNVPQDFYVNLSQRAKKEGLIENVFEEIFDYSNEQIALIMHPIPGITKAEQEKNASLLILYAYKVGLSVDWISAGVLRKLLQNLALGGTNFSTNIRALRSDILAQIQDGENGYKITIPGERKVAELIRGLSES